jgi:hypothetical protein
MPYKKNFGTPLEAKKLVGKFSAMLDIAKAQSRAASGELTRDELKREVSRLQSKLGSFVTAKFPGGDPWYAEVLCFVRVTPPLGTDIEPCETAFIRWYNNAKTSDVHEKIGLPVLKLEKTTRPSATGEIRSEPFTDCALTSILEEPVFLQKDPSTTRKVYIHNKYVK